MKTELAPEFAEKAIRKSVRRLPGSASVTGKKDMMFLYLSGLAAI